MKVRQLIAVLEVVHPDLRVSIMDDDDGEQYIQVVDEEGEEVMAIDLLMGRYRARGHLNFLAAAAYDQASTP